MVLSTWTLFWELEAMILKGDASNLSLSIVIVNWVRGRIRKSLFTYMLMDFCIIIGACEIILFDS